MIIVNETNISNAPIITNVIAEAFTSDPTWSWAIPDLAARKKFWALFVNSAFRYPNIFSTEDFEAVSIWIPPNGSELTSEEGALFPEFLAGLTGTRSPVILDLLNKFDEAHPCDKPHYYLSFLATRNESRGFGYGMGLLKSGLERIDSEKMPAYLESSNPANNKRYQSLGFKPIATFKGSGNGPVVTGMWRESQ